MCIATTDLLSYITIKEYNAHMVAIAASSKVFHFRLREKKR